MAARPLPEKLHSVFISHGWTAHLELTLVWNPSAEQSHVLAGRIFAKMAISKYDFAAEEGETVLLFRGSEDDPGYQRLQLVKEWMESCTPISAFFSPSEHEPTTVRLAFQGFGVTMTRPDVDVSAQYLLAKEIQRSAQQQIPPIGSIFAWHKDLGHTEPSLPFGYMEANGQTVSDPHSPLNGVRLPNLNGEGLFLRGSRHSGALQNSMFQSHSHGGSSGACMPKVRTSCGNHELSHVEVDDRGTVWQQRYGFEENGMDYWSVSFPPGGYAPRGEVCVEAHSHAIAPEGGNETRPANMSVVWILRVK